MNKKILSLSPLLLSTLLPYSTAYSMQEKKSAQYTEFYKTKPKKSAEIAHNNCFEALLQHPRFIEASKFCQQDTDRSPEVTEQSSLNKTVMLEPETLSLPVHVAQQEESSNTTTTPATEEQQQNVNLVISQLMSGSISLDDEQQTTTTSQDNSSASLKSGYSWALTLKALTHSKPDLLLYTLKNEMFEVDNADHRALLDQAIMECVEKMDVSKLETVIAQARKSLDGKLYLQEETVDATTNCITTQQGLRRTLAIKEFAKLTEQQQIAAKAVLEQFKKEQESAVQVLVKGLNAISSAETLYKTNYRTANNQQEKLLHKLEKLSPENIYYDSAPSWDSQTQQLKDQFVQLNALKQQLNQQGSCIQECFSLLTLEDKK